MALDRWIALVFIAFCAVYGYLAFFHDGPAPAALHAAQPGLALDLSQGAVGPGHHRGLIVLFGLEGATEEGEPSATDINYRRLQDYKIGQALMLLG
jgi:putative tricarboxylic transport membrane protein